MSPSLKLLIKSHAKMNIILSGIVLSLLTVNMLLMSSWSEVGGRPLYEGAQITVVLAYSIFVIFAGAMIAAFYIWWANNVLDTLVEQVRKEIAEGQTS